MTMVNKFIDNNPANQDTTPNGEVDYVMNYANNAIDKIETVQATATKKNKSLQKTNE